MIVTRFVKWLSPLLLAGLLGGCAAKEKLPRFLFPPPPDEPRFEFIQNMRSELDFPRSELSKTMSDFVGDVPTDTFKMPIGIASSADGKRVYVSDINDRNVKVFDFKLNHVHYLVKETIFDRPAGLATDGAGRLYVADAGYEAKVFVFAPGADYVERVIKHERLKKAAYVAVNPRLQRLYVSDPLQHRIVVFSLDGQYLFDFGEWGNDDGAMHSPQGIAISKDDQVYICDYFNARIVVFDADGKYLRKFGERGDQITQFENPKSAAFDSDGHLYIGDIRKGTVTVYTAEGQLLIILGSGRPSDMPLSFAAPAGIAIDANDRVYVSDTVAKRFSIWQYLSASYTAAHPVTAADLEEIRNYVRKYGKKEAIEALK